MDFANVSVRLTSEEKKVLEKYAKEHDLTMSQVIRAAIKSYIETNS